MVSESVILGNAGRRLFGVLHLPADAASSVGVLFLGGPGTTRQGPNGLHVRIAEVLAESGIASMRFDYRGRGESEGGEASLTVESMEEDAIAFGNYFAARLGLSQVVLVSHCLGCVAALSMLAERDEYMFGVFLEAPRYEEGFTASGWIRNGLFVISRYRRKLGRIQTWKKIFLFRLQLGEILKSLLVDPGRKHAGSLPDKSRWFKRMGIGKRAFFLWNEEDPNAKEKDFYEDLGRRAGWDIRFRIYERGNRYFMLKQERERAASEIAEWISAIAADFPDSEDAIVPSSWSPGGMERAGL